MPGPEALPDSVKDHSRGLWERVERGAVDEVQAVLDDQIVKVQAIRGSPFCKPFEKECKEWEAKLMYLQESMDAGLAMQKTWLYAEENT